jgi:hypothetical protein
LSTIQRINKQYHNLLNKEQGSSGESSPFMERWGWVYSTKGVADFNNITLNDAYELRVIEYLNTLAYLKDFDKHKDLEYKKWSLQTKLK